MQTLFGFAIFGRPLPLSVRVAFLLENKRPRSHDTQSFNIPYVLRSVVGYRIYPSLIAFVVIIVKAVRPKTFGIGEIVGQLQSDGVARNPVSVISGNFPFFYYRNLNVALREHRDID